MMKILLIMAVIILVLCVIYIMSRRITKEKQLKESVMRRIHCSILILGLGMTVVIFVIGINVLLENNILHSNAVVCAQRNTEEQTIASNIETVALLEGSKSNELSAQEKNTYYGSEVTGVEEGGWDSYQVSSAVVYKNDGYAYLLDSESKTIAGPYLYIEDEIDWGCDTAYRYIGMNGLMGYLDMEGKEITPPMFIDASEMRDGRAFVREHKDSIYYINGEGQKITEDFQDGYPFEHQGCFARVKDSQGWGIINRNGELIFSEADSIEELPGVTMVGSAVKNHHALLFYLDYGAEEEFQVIKEFNQFIEISYVHYGSFSIVKNDESLYGVVNYKGEVIVLDQYISIDFDIVDDGDDSWLGSHIRFKLQNKDGTYSIKDIRI